MESTSNSVDFAKFDLSRIIDVFFDIFNDKLIDINHVLSPTDIAHFIDDNRFLRYINFLSIDVPFIKSCSTLMSSKHTKDDDSKSNIIKNQQLIQNICKHFDELENTRKSQTFVQHFFVYVVVVSHLLNNNHNIYSIGDSLSKYDLMFNVYFNNVVQSIVFSDSICNSDSTINIAKLNLFDANFDNILNSFQQSIDDLKSDKNVVYIDFGCNGKLYVTLRYFFNVLIQKQIITQTQFNNFKLIIFTYNPSYLSSAYEYINEINMIFKNKYGTDLQDIIIDVIDLSDVIDFCMTNSEQLTISRCVPSYKSNQWNTINTSDVFTIESKTDQIIHKNYLACNMGNILLINHFKFLEFSIRIILMIFDKLPYTEILSFVHNSNFTSFFKILSNNIHNKTHFSDIVAVAIGRLSLSEQSSRIIGQNIKNNVFDINDDHFSLILDYYKYGTINEEIIEIMAKFKSKYKPVFIQ